jgi:phage shock protein PspC (stress-responsive transcriptional regulator)
MSEHEPPQTGPAPEPERQPEPEDRGPVPRKLLRARDDRVVSGVAGGLGKYFRVDPVFFRVGFVALAVVGGLGVFLYLAALLFVPAEDGSAEPPRRNRVLTILAAALLVVVGGATIFDGGWWSGGFFFGPLGVLLVVGAAVWWLVWGRPGGGEGRRPRATLARIGIVFLILVGSAVLFAASGWTAAAGGGVAVAILVIAIGALLAAAAFRGGARWLIVPALAIAGGLGVVAAADVDLDGGYGKRVYAPSSLAEVRTGYDLGAGSLEVDLRGVDFSNGEHELELELGLGEAVLVVPREVCVVAHADVGAGYLRMLGWDNGGLNIGWRDGGAVASPDRERDAEPPQAGQNPAAIRAAAAPETAGRLVVDAHVGMGALQVVHDPRDAMGHEDDWDDIEDEEDPALGRSAACVA